MAATQDRRAAVNKIINAQYGDATALNGMQMPKVKRIPFNVLGLDYISGGGVPFGRLSRFWGGEHSCKTLSAWRAAKSALELGNVLHKRYSHMADIARLSGDKKAADIYKRAADDAMKQWADGLNVAYFNIENTFDPLWVTRLGMTPDDIDVYNNQRIEDIGTMVDLMLKERSHEFIILDSCSAAISVQALASDDGLYQNTVGLDARRWGFTLNWWNDRLRSQDADVAIVWIDQIRSKVPIGMSAMQKFEQEEPKGGKAMAHASSLTLQFASGSWLHRAPDGSLRKPDKNAPKDQGAFAKAQPDGKEVHVRCAKNKTSRQDRACLLHFDHQTANFDDLFDIEKLAKYFGVVKRTGEKSSWYTLPDGRKVQKLREHLKQDESLTAAVHDVTLKCAADTMHEAKVLGKLP
jgi:RecA/RadA recombinase